MILLIAANGLLVISCDTQTVCICVAFASTKLTGTVVFVANGCIIIPGLLKCIAIATRKI